MPGTPMPNPMACLLATFALLITAGAALAAGKVMVGTGGSASDAPF